MARLRLHVCSGAAAKAVLARSSPGLARSGLACLAALLATPGITATTRPAAAANAKNRQPVGRRCMKRLPAPLPNGAEPNAIVCPFSRVTSFPLTRRRAADSDVPLQRTPRCTSGTALQEIDQKDVTGLLGLSGPHRRTGLRCVLQTSADQATGQSFGGFPSPFTLCVAKRPPAA